MGPRARTAAIAAAIVLSPAFLAIESAHAAACTTTQNSYTGNGTNGTNGVSYTTFTISTVGACQFTVPAGVAQADVLIVGGGGGGAGGYTVNNSGAGAGGGGGAMVASNYPLTPLSSVNVTVGAGGTGTASSSDGSNRDSTIGAPGGNTVFDSITAGGGGGGGYHSVNGTVTEVGRPGTAGGGAGGPSNHWFAFNSQVSPGTVAPGGTGTSVTVGSKTFTGINGGAGGIYVSNQSGGFDAASGGGAAGAAVNGSSPAPGAALSSYITGTQTNYGGGGKASGASGYTAGTAPTGIGYGGTGGAGVNAGTNGNAGIVVIRILSQAGVNSFGLSGNSTSSTYRGATTISINLTIASQVTFLASGKKIPGCVKVSTSGTSPNIVATCTWRPSLHGNLAISAIIYPNGGGLSSTTGPVSIGISKRTNNR